MHIKFGFFIILLLFASLLFSQTTHLNYEKLISELIQDINKDSISIIINKSEYKLTILYNEKKIKKHLAVKYFILLLYA